MAQDQEPENELAVGRTLEDERLLKITDKDGNERVESVVSGGVVHLNEGETATPILSESPEPKVPELTDPEIQALFDREMVKQRLAAARQAYAEVKIRHRCILAGLRGAGNATQVARDISGLEQEINTLCGLYKQAEEGPLKTLDLSIPEMDGSALAEVKRLTQQG